MAPESYYKTSEKLQRRNPPEGSPGASMGLSAGFVESLVERSRDKDSLREYLTPLSGGLSRARGTAAEGSSYEESWDFLCDLLEVRSGKTVGQIVLEAECWLNSRRTGDSRVMWLDEASLGLPFPSSLLDVLSQDEKMAALRLNRLWADGVRTHNADAVSQALYQAELLWVAE